MDYQNVSVSIDEQAITWITMEVASQTDNTCTQNLIRELIHVFTHIDTDRTCLIVLQSAHEHSFLNGHDIPTFRQLRHKQTALRLAQAGQHLCAEITACKVPVIALIQGYCIGAGLEIALACDYLIGVQSPKTCFSFNEFSLGVHPCFGEVTKLLHRTGRDVGMDFLFSEQCWDAQDAYQKKLIDCCIAHSEIEKTLQTLKPQQKRQFVRHDKTPLLNQLTPSFILRNKLQRIAFRHTKAKQLSQQQQAFIHYWVKQSQGQHPEKYLIQEAESFADLLMGHETQNLVHIRLAERRLDLATTAFQYHPKHICIIGNNLLTQELATYCAQKGLSIVIYARRATDLTKVQEGISAILENLYSTDRVTLNQVNSHIHYSSNISCLEQAELLIDTTDEDMQAKQLLLAELEEYTQASATILTHCLSLDFRELIAPMIYQDRVIGIHFFMPLCQMRLVELAHIPSITPNDKFERVIGFMRLINKLPLSIAGGSDFVIGRILIIYLFQGMRLQQQGVPHNIIDQAARDFGMTLGPLELADRIGLDLCLSLGELAKRIMGLEVPASLSDKTQLGQLGMKSNTGFYRYRHGRMLKPERLQWDGDFELMKKKLVKQMVEETQLCIELGIVEDPDILDACVVWGIGFPEVRGGPIRYAATKRKKKS